MSVPCPVEHCDRPMPGSASICGACEAELRRALAAVRWLPRELDVTLAKQHTREGGGSAEIEDDPNPAVLHIGTLGFDPGASEAAWVLRSALVGWVRVMSEDWTPPIGPVCRRPCAHPSCIAVTGPQDTPVSIAAWLSALLWRLVRHPAAPEAHGELVAAVRGAQRVVDRPADRWYAGICAALLPDDERCQVDLYAKPGAPTVTCPGCGARWDVPERRTWLLDLAEDVLASATEIARAVTRLGRPVTPEAVRGYARRGRILAHGERTVGKRTIPLYRLGDVLDVIAQISERDGTMAS